MKDALIEAVGPWWLVVAVAVIVLGVGRLARIITYDGFPPAKWLRARWEKLTAKHEDWGDLMFCPWCLTPWLYLLAGGWFASTFYVELLAWAWWLFWGWLALSYVTSMVVARDETK